MATRFYLPSSGTAPVTPAYNSDWEDTSIASTLRTAIYKKSTVMTTVSFSDNNALNKDVLYRQFVSPPLVAQTVAAQTIKFQIRASETDIGNNLFTTLHIRVVNNAGTADVGIILAVTRDNSEADNTVLKNRQFSATSLAVTVSEGDRLVFEIGLSGDPANGKSHAGSLRFGDAAAIDLAADDTTTTDDNPWVEFGTGVTMRYSDYKFRRISDEGINTTIDYRVYKNNNGSPLVRSEVLTTTSKVLSGSKTIAQCQTDLNNNECYKWGSPISLQQ